MLPGLPGLPGLEVFGYGFMQRALIAGVLVAAASSVLGVFLVLRGSAMMGDGLAHIAFGGLALGFVAHLSPFGVALGFAIAAALGVQVLRQRGIVLTDTAIAIFFALGLSLGVVLVSLSGGFSVDLFSFLFGSIVAVSDADVALVGALAVALLGTVALLYKELVALTLSEEAAQVAGMPVGALNLVFAVLTAVTIVGAARVVGVLLVSALLVVPAATALQVVRSFGRALVGSALLGVGAVVAGLYVAYLADVAAGGAIALVGALGFFTVLAAKAARRAMAA